MDLSAPRSAWRVALVAVASGTILVPLNSTMLAVALPAIMAGFGVSAGTVSWLVTAYLASVAVTMALSGNVGDRLGHRRMFLAGIVAFAASSLLGAVAGSFPVLVLSRVLQGISGASITTNSVALVQTIAPQDRRGSSFGVLEMLVLVSATAGPFLGGVLVGGFGWRSLFVIAVPIAIGSALLIRTFIPPQEAQSDPPRLDLAGLGLLSVLLVGLLAALSGYRTHTTWAWYVAVPAPLVFALFVARELRAPIPAVDVRLFKGLPFAAAVAAVFGATVILHATMILIPILTQNLLDAAPATSGAVMFGFFGTSALMALLGGRVSDRIGRRGPAVAGSACVAAGLAALWIRPQATILEVALLLGVMGLGFGLSGTPRQTSAIESVPAHSTGMAAGTYFTSRYIGGVAGATLAGTVLRSGVTFAVVAGGFGILTLVAAAVTVASFGLQGRQATSRLIAG